MPRAIRPRFLLTILFLAAIPLALLAFCQGGPSYYSAKYSPAETSARPAATPSVIIPERQTEPHTCGLHSLSAIYSAYGLDAERLRLRFRVGVDKPFANFLPDTTGAIHPDMLRVLGQDGFRAEVVLPSSSDAAKRLREHLEAGHPAIALTRATGLHWVVLRACAGDEVVICDSLEPLEYGRPLGSYLNESVYSLVLVRPK